MTAPPAAPAAAPAITSVTSVASAPAITSVAVASMVVASGAVTSVAVTSGVVASGVVTSGASGLAGPRLVGRSEPPAPFRVRLADFDGPFDLLLGLIASHELDVTRLALATVTEEFLTHLRTMAAAGGFDLDEASEFVVVAATLLDLKAARLLPRGEVEDAEDVAALEARDLLFVRLLQYRAYKEVAGVLAARAAAAALRFPAAVGPGDAGDALPEVAVGITPERFAALAARVAAPRPRPVIGLGHLHAPPVSVGDQSSLLRARLRSAGSATFTVLTADAPGLDTVVARFLALLELFRDGLVSFEQPSPLAELTVHWGPGPAAAAPEPAP